MATYKEIKGVTIQTKDSDPVVGGIPGGTWASGGNMNTARSQGANGLVGSQTAAIFIAGENPGPTNVALVESYDGSSFTEIADVNTARRIAAASGVQTAALFFGGYTSSNVGNTESWNGSSWTEVNDLNSARRAMGGSGTYTAALCAGGGNPSGAETETWDGTSWTEVGDLNEGRNSAPAVGTQTASISIGDAPNGALVEQWDGSSWTEVGDLNTGRYGAAGGLYNSALVFQGTNGTRQTLTEFWDGTSWTEVADTAQAKQDVSGAGASSSAALSAGGYITNFSATSEEFTTAPVTAAILTEGSIFLSGGTTLKGFGKAAGIPAATFASGGSLNTARGYHGGAGTDHEALLAFGGNTGSATAITEQYNGSSWTEVSDLNTARANVTGFGSSTAAIAGNGSTPTKVETESWDGSSWTEIAETNFPRSDSTGAGTQTSGMIATGTPVPGNPSLQPGGTSTVTETWNGTSWTEVGDTNTKRLQAGMAGSGTTSASIIAAGEDGPGSRTVNAETWNGTSWTEVNNLSNQRGTLYNFMGNVSLANAAGGYSGTARLATNEHWNGTSWTEINDLSTARNAAYGAGAAADGAVFGGSTPSYTTATEEFVADNTLSTVTVS